MKKLLKDNNNVPGVNELFTRIHTHNLIGKTPTTSLMCFSKIQLLDFVFNFKFLIHVFEIRKNFSDNSGLVLLQQNRKVYWLPLLYIT